MENKFKKFINDNKGFVVFYLVWFLLNLIFVSIGEGYNDFWPFEGHESYRLRNYGGIEFIFYLIVPIVIWGIWKLAGKDILKIMDKLMD